MRPRVTDLAPPLPKHAGSYGYQSDGFCLTQTGIRTRSWIPWVGSRAFHPTLLSECLNRHVWFGSIAHLSNSVESASQQGESGVPQAQYNTSDKKSSFWRTAGLISRLACRAEIFVHSTQLCVPETNQIFLWKVCTAFPVPDQYSGISL